MSSPTGLQGRILSEFARLAPTARGGMVSIAEVRRSLGVGQAEFDAAVLALDRADQLRVVAVGDRSSLSSQDLRDSIQGVNETFAYVETGPEYRAPAATPAPAPIPPPTPPSPAPPPAPPAAPPTAEPGAPGIAEAAGFVPHYDEPIGVRVRMQLIMVDTAGRDIPGSEGTRDVTMNVNPGTPVQDVLAAAIAYAEEGNLGRRNNEHYRVRVLAAHIARLTEGGYDDPSLRGVI